MLFFLFLRHRASDANLSIYIRCYRNLSAHKKREIYIGMLHFEGIGCTPSQIRHRKRLRDSLRDEQDRIQYIPASDTTQTTKFGCFPAAFLPIVYAAHTSSFPKQFPAGSFPYTHHTSPRTRLDSKDPPGPYGPGGSPILFHLVFGSSCNPLANISQASECFRIAEAFRTLMHPCADLLL